MLRVHDLAAEPLTALELGRESLVVAVVAAGAEQPATADRQLLAGVGPLDLDEPAALVLDQAALRTLWWKRILLVDAVFGRRLAQVVEDRVGAGDRLLVLPRLELVAEGVQVRIGANARDSGTDPMCRRSRRAPRGSRSSCGVAVW